MHPLAAVLSSAALAISADQASKTVTSRLLASGRLHPTARRSGLRWQLNARGLVALPLGWAVILWMAALGGAVLLVGQGSAFLGSAGAIGMGLVLGGATGNLVDRVRRGGVVDFIAIGAWPTFNLADAAMVIGTTLLAVSLA